MYVCVCVCIYIYIYIYIYIIYCNFTYCIHILKNTGGFPGGAVVESLPADAGDTGSSPGLGRSHMPRSN